MSGAPKPTASPSLRDYGIAYSSLNNGAVWRRSHHTTQMIGVTSDTAPALAGDEGHWRAGCPRKPGATLAKTLALGGRVAASLQPTEERAC